MSFNDDIRDLMGVPIASEEVDITTSIGSNDEQIALFESQLIQYGFKEQPIDLYSGDLEMRSQKRFAHPKLVGEIVLDVYGNKVAGWYHHSKAGLTRKHATILQQGVKTAELTGYLRTPKQSAASAPKRATLIINDMSFYITGTVPSQLSECIDYVLESVEDKEEYKVSIDNKGFVRRVE